MKTDENKVKLIQNEWPVIDKNFHSKHVILNYLAILTRIIGKKELFDSLTIEATMYKLFAGQTTMVALLENLGR